MNKDELKNYVITEAKKVLTESGEIELDESLGGLSKSAEEKALQFANNIIAQATKVSKKVGHQWLTNLIRNKFKIKSGEIPRILKQVTGPLYKTQDASQEYSIRQHMSGGGAGTIFAPTESVELAEGVTPEEVEKLVEEINKINKKVDLRQPLLAEDTNSIVDLIIPQKKKEVITEVKEIDRWKNLTEYRPLSDESC